jgi:RNA polymerase sigma factor (TIGR02999 family)
MRPSDADITRLLHELKDQNDGQLDAVLPLVYDRIRALAQRQLQRLPRSPTLSATVLANEAYLKLHDGEQQHWQDREHFFAVMAVMLRRLVIDHARSVSAQKRGGRERPASLAELEGLGIEPISEPRSESLLRLDAALNRLADIDERAGQVVEMKFFGGFTSLEIADVLKVSEVTVKRDWRFARAWLQQAMQDDD